MERNQNSLRSWSSQYINKDIHLLRASRSTQSGFPFVAMVLIAVLFCCTGCGGRSGIQKTESKVLDLTDRFLPAEFSPPDAHFEQNLYVNRRGVRKSALVVAAPTSLCASLQGISGNVILKGWAAPVFNIGDGLEMNLFLRRGKTRFPIFRRGFDAARIDADRAWVPIEIALDLTGEDRLEMDVTAGPQGELTADWLALSGFGLVTPNSGS
jgi:hypothetical protein